jgi:transposase
MFADEDTCLETVLNMVYPDGIHCRKCQEVTKHHRLNDRKAYSCQYCGTQVYPLAGTIFEKSSTPLKSWFYAMYLMASTRTGISAKQLERELGVTYKTAWRMFKQSRSILNEDVDLEGLLVEVDETYIGGKAANMHHAKRERLGGRGTAGKQPVFGMIERHGKVVTKVVPDVSRNTLLPNIREKVLPSSLVYSDEHSSYDPLKSMGYQHRRAHHGARVYVVGDVHTNTIEGFWSLVKRGISEVNHAVGVNHLQGYFDFYAFRWNHRDDETPMYESMSNRVNKVRYGKYGAYNPIGDSVQ